MSNQRMMQVPSLVDLCVWTAIDNVKYLGDVGETDLDLVGKILQHCTVDQLRHVEDSTEGRDLSPVTDALWEKFYRKEFNETSFKAGDYESFREEALSTVRRKKFASKWRFKFEVGMKIRELKEKKSTSVLMEKYKKENAKKQSKQIQICAKAPPSSKRRFFGGSGPGYNFSNTKNNLMKKSKIDLMKSKEMQNRLAVRKNAVQRTYIAPPKMKPASFLRDNAASSSKGRF
ncbi:hypothetical protein QQ045_010731 [Rhodiola kirilowii]